MLSIGYTVKDPSIFEKRIIANKRMQDYTCSNKSSNIKVYNRVMTTIFKGGIS